MNRLQTYRLLRQHGKLSEKRNPALEQNKVAKVLMYVGAAVMAIYLIIFGSMIGKFAAEDDFPGLLLMVLPFFLLFDFLSRFAIQQTPMMFIKPYLLLDIKRDHVIESYLVNMVTSSYNFLWLTLLLPYAYICLVAGISFWKVLAVVVAGLLLVMANSQWYLLVRTLVMRSLLWWLMPIGVAGACVGLFFLLDQSESFSDLLDELMDSAPALWLVALVALALLVAMLLLNRALQKRFIMQEISREQKKPSAMKHVWQFAFLENFGMAGEYLKLELKSIFRNKAIRARVVSSLFLIVVLSALITYTDVYDGFMLLNFWCYYCFAIYGMTALTKVMGPEGNYIDLLMTQRENILLLLKAKYYFHVAILIVPAVIMLPAVIAGKFTVMMVLAYLLLTSGLGYFIMFQLAVYNKPMLPLDSKLVGKNGVESGLQLVIELVGMFVPLLLVGGMLMLTEENTAYMVMAILGLLLTIAHPLWLRNIYERMMTRKYENLEGFHASR